MAATNGGKLRFSPARIFLSPDSKSCRSPANRILLAHYRFTFDSQEVEVSGKGVIAVSCSREAGGIPLPEAAIAVARHHAAVLVNRYPNGEDPLQLCIVKVIAGACQAVIEYCFAWTGVSLLRRAKILVKFRGRVTSSCAVRELGD